MTDSADDRRDLHRRVRSAGIVWPPFTRSGGIVRTILLGRPREERIMEDTTQRERWERELPLPDGADTEGSSEILRAWIVHGELGVSMRSQIVPHPAQWGGILADLARYVMLVFDDGTDRAKCQEILDDVVRGFEERLLNPEQTHIEVSDREDGGS